MPIRNKIDTIVKRLIIFLMVAIVLDVLLQVISRYIFQSPFGFTDELAGFLLIWLGLVGAAYATGERQHLAIDLISNKFSGQNKQRHSLVIYSLMAIFTILVFVIGGCWLVYTSFLYNQQSAALQVPLGVVYLVVPFSGFLILYYCFDNALITHKSFCENPVK